ncbi:cytochrome B [Hydrogenophaga crassostreae]|uniref:Cytochrome B n=1 Tax=Hydrogenophaga crassostreae TaxID=1763535 RepID=A0A162P573_9BURK|nr:cytochrome b/b6 domain-containing protein [Hydrogenophaga crassostreae]AOW15889.1 cytochrome B [Hydrogenophaga crassostreae]OAD41435.1 cytochrome B [Hydrogenophaga crassostreae]
MSRNPSTRYDPLSMAFHWLTAIAVLAAFILGPGGFGRLLRQGIDPGTHADIVWHESLGMLIFSLTVLRLLWTAVRPAAPQVAMSGPLCLASKLGHAGLWGLLLITPITALLTLGSEGAPLTLLGGFRIEQLGFIANSGLASLTNWGEVHSLMGDAIIWLAGLHALAAIAHHVKLKDGVLVSMVPWLKPR